jgi:hypothetical protein
MTGSPWRVIVRARSGTLASLAGRLRNPLRAAEIVSCVISSPPMLIGLSNGMDIRVDDRALIKAFIGPEAPAAGRAGPTIRRVANALARSRRGPANDSRRLR